jgi:hypothetical protein
MLLQSGAGGCAVGLFGGDFERERVGESEANEGFGWNLNLLAARDGVDSGTGTAAGSCTDGCALASSKDAAEDGTDGCSAADLLGGVRAPALALDAIGFGGDGELFAMAVDAGEFDCEQGAAFVVGCLLNGRYAAGDGSALANDDEAVGDDVSGYGSGEEISLLGGGAVEGLGDADGDDSVGCEGDITEGGRWRRRRGWGWKLFLRWRWWGGSGGLGCGGFYRRGRGWGLTDYRCGFGCWGGFGLRCDRGGKGRRRCGCGGDRGRGSLNGEVVDHGFYAYDLGGVGSRERASGFAADGTVQGGDLFLDGRLNGLAAEGAIACDSALEGGGEGGIVSGGRWMGALAAGEGKDQGEGADGDDGARDSDFLYGVHTSPFVVAKTALRTL